MLNTPHSTIIITESVVFEYPKQNKKTEKNKKNEKIQNIEDEVASMKNDINDIKSLLKELVNGSK